MTLVPYPRRDPSHGMAGRIAAKGERDALTRPGESCIVEISGALQGPSRGEPVRASRPVRGPGDAPVSRPVATPCPDRRRLPRPGVVGRLALRPPQPAEPGPVRGPGGRPAPGPPRHPWLLARGLAPPATGPAVHAGAGARLGPGRRPRSTAG